MKLKGLRKRTILGTTALFFTFTACISHNELPLPKHEQEESGMPIRWYVIPEEMLNGRALINSTANLQTACSTGGQAIGIWSAYEQGTDYQEDVLGNENGDVGLIYQPTPIWDNWQGWTYGEKAAFWKHGAIHYFTAYFPMTGGLTDVQNTKTTITGHYNTEVNQTDLLVTRTVVDTGADDFAGSPVPLDMKHALAAIRFQFQSVDGVPMILKSFALQNTIEEGMLKGLGTSGTLTCQGTSVGLSNWAITSPLSLDKLYDWQHSGVKFSTTSVTAYQKTGTIVGNLYTNNDGYILIIPQEYDGNTKMIFETDKNTIPYEVTLPAPSKESTENKFLPGYRYTYLVKIAGKDVTLECVARPWDLVETTNEFSTVVSVLEEDRVNWTAGSHNDSDTDPNNDAQIVLWDDINNPAEFSFKISHPLGGTWHAVLRTISGATDAFELHDTDGNIKMDGAVGEDVTLRVYAKRENKTTVSNVAELMFVVRSSGHILPVDMITVLGDGQNYSIVQNINK